MDIMVKLSIIIFGIYMFGKCFKGAILLTENFLVWQKDNRKKPTLAGVSASVHWKTDVQIVLKGLDETLSEDEKIKAVGKLSDPGLDRWVELVYGEY